MNKKAETQQRPSSAFPFESKFKEVNGSQIHYIDVGEGDPILFLHGNPTSSYLWRNIIPHVQAQGRCIAPDLIGMGKSDKPDITYGFTDTYDYLEGFIEKMGLDRITLVIHDWGSGLGFHYAHSHPEKIKGIAFMEAVYRHLNWDKLPAGLRFGMGMMRSTIGNYLMLGVMNYFIEGMLPKATMSSLSKEVMAYYRSPYPTLRSRKPIRKWPKEIARNGKPEAVHRIIQEYHEWLKVTPIPKLCLYADPGMVITHVEVPWIEANFPNTTLVDIGKGLHFVQEDQPDNIGEALQEWIPGLSNP